MVETKDLGATAQATAAEQTELFNETYKARTTNTAFLNIEEKICGCRYGSTSWTTRAEADAMLGHLNMNADTHLLDVGSGAGWPALYVADQTGCRVTLSDLPYEGISIAKTRATKDGMGARANSVVASGASLPFEALSFDVITHSDVLCCLEPKIEVLEACRRVIKNNGTMAFWVIYLAPGLTGTDLEWAIAGSPNFTPSPAPYEQMLEDTGWRIIHRSSVAKQYLETARTLKKLEEAAREELVKVWGEEGFDEIMMARTNYALAAEKGFTQRDLFIVKPA